MLDKLVASASPRAGRMAETALDIDSGMVEGSDYALPEPFAAWFADRGWGLRPHQAAMLRAARDHVETLLIAPTGGGKTLGGFLPSLVELAAGAAGRGLHTLYISPLKALSTDVGRNLAT